MRKRKEKKKRRCSHEIIDALTLLIQSRILQWEEKSKDQMAIDLATMSPGEAAYILAGLGFTEALALISHMQPNQVRYRSQYI